ncbi:MAG: S8 family serine peptidase [Chromatiales bacterium]|nr:S8 family serine peptidase [Chromatiales bacterium]
MSQGEFGKASYASENGRSVYIIQLADQPVATYDGSIQGLEATSNKITGASKLNTNSKESKAYRKYLKGKQDKFIADAGITSGVKYEYQYVLNGLAVEMTPDQAKAMASVPGVKSVTRERIETLNTDAGPEWINAGAIWGGTPNNVPHSQGQGVVIAILDSGVNHDHPSFAAMGGDGYQHVNPLGSGNFVPGSYCDVTDSSFCNDKLVGAWSFVPTDAAYPAPEDNNGHGSHTASTSGGNVIQAATAFAPTTSLTRKISGVAPHANLVIYDVCVDDGGCPGSALIAAINQVVVDSANIPGGIQSLNYSISGGEDPYNDPVEIGFLNATAAGVYVSASAGNAGPGASTLGHQSPWVATTAASTHNRKITNSVVDMTSDQGGYPDLAGVGFTDGYGPASIVYAGDYPTANGSANDTDPAQCLDPFPSGHFNGEIVICDRGAIARVAKGANVLAGGAGGLVLANLAANGESVTGDGHYLPAVHLGVTAGDELKAWVAGVDNAMGSISGYVVDLNPDNGDIMAGFSSRGPNSALDVLKPDMTAPGVDILAAVSTVSSGDPDEYDFLSGTSMSSPHNAGAGAIVSGARPDLTPYEVKSAIMMTSDNSYIRKEDGVSLATPFDHGAGRIDLSRAVESGLVMDETPDNFWFANPATGGDPKTLNLASMQDGSCVGDCSWTRTFTNKTEHTIHTDVVATTTGGANITVSPSRLKIKSGQTGSITVSADTTQASGWTFGQIDLLRKGDGPDLHLPVAVLGATSSDANVFTKTVDKAEAAEGETLTYQIDIANGQLADEIHLTDSIPAGLTPVAGSETESVNGGTTSSAFTINGNTATWSGSLDVGSIAVVPSVDSPAGFLPLSIFGIAPRSCPSNCDDGALLFNVPAFTYNGTSYSQVIFSVNGTLEAGTASGSAASANNQNLPSATPPNNILAPFWSDLNLGAGGTWSVGVLCGGPTCWTIFEWNDVPQYGDDTARYSFQVWLEIGSSGNIWYTYGDMSDASLYRATVGAENSDGTLGASYYYDGVGIAPLAGDEVKVGSVVGGTASLSFQATVDSCAAGSSITNRADIASGDKTEKAIAVTTCTE